MLLATSCAAAYANNVIAHEDVLQAQLVLQRLSELPTAGVDAGAANAALEPGATCSPQLRGTARVALASLLRAMPAEERCCSVAELSHQLQSSLSEEHTPADRAGSVAALAQLFGAVGSSHALPVLKDTAFMRPYRI